MYHIGASFQADEREDDGRAVGKSQNGRGGERGWRGDGWKGEEEEEEMEIDDPPAASAVCSSGDVVRSMLGALLVGVRRELQAGQGEGKGDRGGALSIDLRCESLVFGILLIARLVHYPPSCDPYHPCLFRPLPCYIL